MPRVTAQHPAVLRPSIAPPVAAFARGGLHRTSLPDLVAEAEMSLGESLPRDGRP